MTMLSLDYDNLHSASNNQASAFRLWVATKWAAALLQRHFPRWPPGHYRDGATAYKPKNTLALLSRLVWIGTFSKTTP
jgi:hypothetical protein